ncbi:MAG: hypothetical protein RLZZ515_59 [Cyanobacteriota bacterium]|jgi:hypothetical protein
MFVGALYAAFFARRLPNPVASGAVTASTQAPPEERVVPLGRKDAAEQLLLQHFDYLDPFLVRTLFFWAHIYLTCTDASFQLFTDSLNDPDRRRS